MEILHNHMSASTAGARPPITIRTLHEIAQREGWDPDTPLSLRDPASLDELAVCGLAFVPDVDGLGCIELDTAGRAQWADAGHVREVNFAFNDRVREAAELLAVEYLDESNGDVATLTECVVFALRPMMLHAFDHVCWGIGSDVAYGQLGKAGSAA
jgi:hypothetical protein